MFLHHNMNFFMKIAIFENVSWGHLKSKIFKNNIRKWNLSLPFKVFQELPMFRIIYKKIKGRSGKYKKDFLPGLYYIKDNVPATTDVDESYDSPSSKLTAGHARSIDKTW